MNFDGDYVTMKLPSKWFEDSDLEYEYEVVYNYNKKYIKEVRCPKKDYRIHFEDEDNIIRAYYERVAAEKYLESFYSKHRSILNKKNIFNFVAIQLDISHSEKKSNVYSEIYIINMVGTNFYKIGYAKNSEQRLKILQIGNPFELTLVNSFLINNPKKVEKNIHTKLAEHKVRGEWFDLSPKELDCITELLNSNKINV